LFCQVKIRGEVASQGSFWQPATARYFRPFRGLCALRLQSVARNVTVAGRSKLNWHTLTSVF